jgi:hypothetical protein
MRLLGGSAEAEIRTFWTRWRPTNQRDLRGRPVITQLSDGQVVVLTSASWRACVRRTRSSTSACSTSQASASYVLQAFTLVLRESVEPPEFPTATVGGPSWLEIRAPHWSEGCRLAGGSSYAFRTGW